MKLTSTKQLSSQGRTIPERCNNITFGNLKRVAKYLLETYRKHTQRWSPKFGQCSKVESHPLTRVEHLFLFQPYSKVPRLRALVVLGFRRTVLSCFEAALQGMNFPDHLVTPRNKVVNSGMFGLKISCFAEQYDA